LLPAWGGRPAGSRFLDEKLETIIAEEFDQFYLRLERPRLSDLCDRIGARCHEVGAKPPNWRTVYSRVRDCDAKLKARRRQDTAAMARFAVVPGELVADRPLDLVQIDHTEVDVIVVDPKHRQSVKRPWLTLAIDVHSRMVVGYHLSLDEPSAVSRASATMMVVVDRWFNGLPSVSCKLLARPPRGGSVVSELLVPPQSPWVFLNLVLLASPKSWDKPLEMLTHQANQHPGSKLLMRLAIH
jgi:hypothetical protein